MNTIELEQQILAILSNIAPEIDTKMISKTKPLRSQIEIDSMDYLNLIEEIHKQLGVEIPEMDYGKVRSLSELVDYISDVAS